MIAMTLRDNKRSLQPTAEAQNLTDIALCQLLRFLLGLLPGSKQVIIALITATQFAAWVADSAGCKKLCSTNFPRKEGGGERQDQLIASRERHH